MLMDFDDHLISHTLEHRGCGIRAASYEVRPQSWLPEHASGSKPIGDTERSGCIALPIVCRRRAHFSQPVRCRRWAMFAAKSVIDRAIEEVNVPAVYL